MRKCVTLLLLLCSAFASAVAQRASSPSEPETFQTDTLTQTGTSILAQTINLEDSLQSDLSRLQQLPNRYFNKVSNKADKLNRRLTKRTQKALRRLQKQEKKINSKLSKIDSIAAHNLLTTSIDSLSHLKNMIKGKVSRITGKIPGSQYISYLDTLKNSLDFLNKYSDKLSKVKEVQQRLQSSLSSVQQLQGRLNQLQEVQQYIQERKQVLNETLGKYGNVFKENLGKIGKEVYYYKAQIKNYKELWQHPDKIEAKALEMLNKVPAFNDFMKEHSALAALFNVAGSQEGSLQQSLQGLQTRAMVQQEIQERLQAAGAGGRKQIQQQMTIAKQKLQELKNKLPGGGSTANMPNFKPKELKSKTFFQRLGFGANVQFGKATNYLPTTSDIAGQIAYKFSKNGSIGIGASFKLGWSDPLPQQNIISQNPFGSTQGSSGFSQGSFSIAPRSFIKKIHFTAQGVGIRSFLDYKLKGTFYVNGGFEFNYNKTIPNIPALKNLNGWTKSALLGIEKKYKISNKLKGNMMLLFDFLYKQHVPQTQPVVFRVGYNF